MSKHGYEYEDVRDLIFFQARRFYLRYGGELDEIVGQALFIYVKASLKFKFRQGTKFSSYIANRIWKGLIDFYKRRFRNPQPLLEDLITERIISIPSYSDKAVKFKVELFDRITPDARFIVKKIFEPDHKLKCILRYKRGKRIERRAIRQYLTKHRNWTHSRVDTAFWRLQKAIRD